MEMQVATAAAKAMPTNVAGQRQHAAMKREHVHLHLMSLAMRYINVYRTVSGEMAKNQHSGVKSWGCWWRHRQRWPQR